MKLRRRLFQQLLESMIAGDPLIISMSDHSGKRIYIVKEHEADGPAYNETPNRVHIIERGQTSFPWHIMKKTTSMLSELLLLSSSLASIS